MSTPIAPATVMFGKPVADAMDARLVEAVPAFTERHKVTPTLAIVLVGHSAASERYVKKKIEACARLKMRAELKPFAADISADDLKDEVARVGRSPDVHGVLVQLPLPSAIQKHE